VQHPADTVSRAQRAAPGGALGTRRRDPRWQRRRGVPAGVLRGRRRRPAERPRLPDPGPRPGHPRPGGGPSRAPRRAPHPARALDPAPRRLLSRQGRAAHAGGSRPAVALHRPRLAHDATVDPLQHRGRPLVPARVRRHPHRPGPQGAGRPGRSRGPRRQHARARPDVPPGPVRLDQVRERLDAAVRGRDASAGTRTRGRALAASSRPWRSSSTSSAGSGSSPAAAKQELRSLHVPHGDDPGAMGVAGRTFGGSTPPSVGSGLAVLRFGESAT
jgi:hypothetical protein